MSNPREGTILSVIAAFAASLRSRVRKQADEPFGPLLQAAVATTKHALEKTQDQLDVLRKAGVVDAGAKGFVSLIEGMTDYIAHGREPEAPDLSRIADDADVIETAGAETDLEYRFCTECTITGVDIDRRKLREALSALGNSLVLAGTKRKAKVHIHVNDPDEVFQTAGQFGTLTAQKADDMQRQQHSTHGTAAKFAVITDSAADIADDDMERLDIHMVPLRVQFGDRGYLDKVGITPEEFFDELRTNPQHPTTSQPSAGDFRRQYQFLASHFPDVLSINLTGKASGTLQAATSAAERTNASGTIHVVDTLNASLGQGLLTVLAAECAQAGLDVETTRGILERAIPETHSFALVRDLTYAVRGGRVPSSRKFIADVLHLTPVLRTTPDGQVSSGGVLLGRRNLLPRFARFIAKRLHGTGPLRFAVGHADNPTDAAALEKTLLEVLPDAQTRGVTSLGSALGVHAGPGALVVGVQRVQDTSETGAN